MSKELYDPSQFDGKEETVIGIHESGIELQEGLNTSLSRNYCANCKRKIHCYVKVDKKTKEATVHITCKSSDCECKCKTHYACKQCGHLHAYGEKCNNTELEYIAKPKDDEAFQKILEDWRKLHDEN